MCLQLANDMNFRHYGLHYSEAITIYYVYYPFIDYITNFKQFLRVFTISRTSHSMLSLIYYHHWYIILKLTLGRNSNFIEHYLEVPQN